MLKNVKYTSYDDYLKSFVKSLSNFCDKCPLKPTVKVVKPLGIVYVYNGDEEIEIKVNVNEDKKSTIGWLKSKLEKKYPIVYQKIESVPTAEEVREILSKGKTLEEALNTTSVVYKPLYKVERVHDKYNELDLFSLEDGNIYKFKCKIPVMAILEDLKYNDKESDVLSNVSLMYKINSEKQIVRD